MLAFTEISTTEIATVISIFLTATVIAPLSIYFYHRSIKRPQIWKIINIVFYFFYGLLGIGFVLGSLFPS